MISHTPAKDRTSHGGHRAHRQIDTTGDQHEGHPEGCQRERGDAVGYGLQRRQRPEMRVEHAEEANEHGEDEREEEKFGGAAETEHGKLVVRRRRKTTKSCGHKSRGRQRRRREFARDFTAGEDDDAIAQRGEFLVVARRDQNRRTGCGALPEQRVDAAARGDIDATRRLIEQPHAHVAVQPAADDHLLLIAAAEFGDRLCRARVAHLKLRKQAGGFSRLGATIEPAGQKAPKRKPGDAGVEAHAARPEESVMFAVLRHKREAGGDRGARGRWRKRRWFGAEKQRASRNPIRAKDRSQQLRAPGPDQAAETENLARISVKRDSAHSGTGVKIDHAQGEFPAAGRREVRARSRGFAGHEGNELLARSVARWQCGDKLAVAQHTHAIGEHGDLVEPMADVEERSAFGAEFAQENKQRLNFRAGERRRRLIKDEHATLLRQSGGDLDELLVADPERGR